MKQFRNSNNLSFREAIAGYLFIAPLFLGLFIFYIAAFFGNFYDSFTNKSSFGTPKFIGVDNYVKLFSDQKFYRATLNTFLYVIICVPLVVILSTALGALLNAKIKGKGFFRTLIFLPAVTLPAAIGLLWKWIFNYEFGILNAIIVFFGGNPIAWLSDPSVVLISISVVFIWSTVSYQMIIILAGLQGVSKSYYEAAEIDGASSMQSFFKISIPLISPSIFFVTVTSTINVFQMFDYIYLMIPQSSSGVVASRSLVTFFFEEAFIKFNKGYGAAISMVLFVLILIVTIIQLRMQKKWVHYD